MARVVVVGGGIGGTAAAARLAKLRHDVTVVERLDRLGGALGHLDHQGFRWDTGPSATALPAALRDLFRKSGRPLERELELVPVQPLREHRFVDGTVVALPAGSRGAQLDAVSSALGTDAGRAWVDYVHTFADVWDVLRRGYLERPWSPAHADPRLDAILSARGSLQSSVRRWFSDERLRRLALTHALLAGHRPRDVPAWFGVLDYVDQSFGSWTAAGGLGQLSTVLTHRLVERRVDVRLETRAIDLVVRDRRVTGVETTGGLLAADVVVCAVDPRGLPALDRYVRRTSSALPPAVSYLGLSGDLPDLPHEVVLHGELHGDPPLALRTGGSAPQGHAAWTVLSPGGLEGDVLDTLARRGLDLRGRVSVRIDRSARDQVLAWGGSPYGVRWQGRATVRRRLAAQTPIEGVFAAGAHAAGLPGLPFAALTAAVVAELVGAAER